MITTELAHALQAAGLRWDPGSGDRFVVVDPPLPEEVFTVSEMTVEVYRQQTGTIIGFNGTTEWALDSVDQQRTLWLPREAQLRELLAGAFRQLRRLGPDRWQVDIQVGDTSHSFESPDAERAYALALVYLITGERAAEADART